MSINAMLKDRGVAIPDNPAFRHDDWQRQSRIVADCIENGVGDNVAWHLIVGDVRCIEIVAQSWGKKAKSTFWSDRRPSTPSLFEATS